MLVLDRGPSASVLDRGSSATVLDKGPSASVLDRGPLASVLDRGPSASVLVVVSTDILIRLLLSVPTVGEFFRRDGLLIIHDV